MSDTKGFHGDESVDGDDGLPFQRPLQAQNERRAELGYDNQQRVPSTTKL